MEIAHTRDVPVQAVAVDVSRLLLIDDDELSREVLGLVAAEAGLEAESFESGEEALAYLGKLDANLAPDAILTDMQMPGISGTELAVQLRTVCGPRTLLLAMSGSAVARDTVAMFDGFLLKPFSSGDLLAACERRGTQAEGRTLEGVLNEAVYANFSRSMPPLQVAALYAMCLDDANKRLDTMRAAVASQDDAGYRRAAHAIKGGCGMVGAVELARLAAEMEEEGIAAVYDETPFHQFVAAAAKLGRMLKDKADGPGAVVGD